MSMAAWAAGIALVVSPDSAAGERAPDLLDSLRLSEGIMAYRVVFDSREANGVGSEMPERRECSRAAEGEMKDRWNALLTGPGLVRGSDCEPACYFCEDRVRYRLYFPPFTDRLVANILWDEQRVQMVSNGRTIAHRSLNRNDTAWVALLQETFPGDSVTRALTTSDPKSRAPNTPPDPREIVFVDDLPNISRRVRPTYPPGFESQRIGGAVTVHALVGENGRVRDAFCEEQDRGFNEPALTAVRQWIFKPARCGGRPVAVWVVVPIKFSAH